MGGERRRVSEYILLRTEHNIAMYVPVYVILVGSLIFSPNKNSMGENYIIGAT